MTESKRTIIGSFTNEEISMDAYQGSCICGEVAFEVDALLIAS